MKRNIAVIILAAGKGSRMYSKIPKVLHTIHGKPMLSYIIEAVDGIKGIKQKIVIAGYRYELIEKFLIDREDVSCVRQKNILGTADAIKSCKGTILKDIDTVLVIYGDSPFLEGTTLGALVDLHIKSNAKATLLTAKIDNPAGYGRIIRDNNGVIVKISEEKELNYNEKAINEINVGATCFNKDELFNSLNKIQSNNVKGEYYLTDIVDIFSNKGIKIESLELKDITEAQGINSYDDLQTAQDIMHSRIMRKHIDNLVNIIDPKTTFIDSSSSIGENTTIYPFTIIESNVKIGKYCKVGPFCHLRPGSIIEDNAEIGNFIEVVRSHIGKRTKAKHFGYLGDARIGSEVNIGAGTVTANFDGVSKNVTRIKNKAFIGSDTVLIAPVSIAEAAVTGAGSVVVAKTNISKKEVFAGVPAKKIKKN